MVDLLKQLLYVGIFVVIFHPAQVDVPVDLSDILLALRCSCLLRSQSELELFFLECLLSAHIFQHATLLA